MGVDTTEIGRVTAELMESIEDDHEDGASIGTVMVVAEVKKDDGYVIHYRCSDPREWIQKGLLIEALDLARRPPEDDE